MAKILVVEDEEILRELIVDQLNDVGHSTFEAGNGREGLDILAKDTPDLIVSDITMPVMNGYQFLRSVREEHLEHARTPFLFMTALSDRESELKGLRLGVDDYITKPIDYEILIARIDANLRRRQMQAILDHPAPSNTDSLEAPLQEKAEPTARHPIDRSLDQGDAESIEKLSSIADRDNGRLAAGKFRTLSLDQVRTQVGDRWSEVSNRILRNAEQVICENLDSNDVFHITPSQDFLVCFAELHGDQAAAKVDQIRDRIWERLFGETHDETLASVDGNAYDITLAPENLSEKDDIFSHVEACISDQDQQARSTSYQSLEKIYTYEDLEAVKLLGAKGAPSKIKQVSFKRNIRSKIRKLLNDTDLSDDCLIELQNILFKRLRSQHIIKEISKQPALLMPIEFAFIKKEESRKYYVRQCKSLEEHIGSVIITEFIEIPDRIAPYAKVMRSIVGNRKLQFLEIKRPEQVHGLELRDLHIVFVSMSYDHAMRESGNGLTVLRKKLSDNNIKFFLKEIPEGNIIKAQNLKADLYSS